MIKQEIENRTFTIMPPRAIRHLKKIGFESRRSVFDLNNRPQIFGTAAAFHYINRMVSIFLPPEIAAMPGMKNRYAKIIIYMIMKYFGKRITALDTLPGQSIMIPENQSNKSRELCIAKAIA